jgi:hypothetical protein
MNKPAKPVSLAPVKALSTPAPVAQPALAKVAETPVEKPFAAQAESAQPQAVAAPRVEAPKPEAATVEATRPEVPKAESPRPQADRPQADRPQAYKPAAGMPEAGKLEERPAAGTVAAPAPPSVVAITPASAPAKPAEKAAVQMPAPRAIVARPAAAKSAAAKSGPAKSGPAKSGPAKSGPAKPAAAKSAAAKSGPAPKAAGKIADAAPANPLSALGSLFSMPGLSPGFVPPALAATEFPVPAFSADMMAEFASRWLDAARTLGTVQARLLDHGVRQLKAGMAEFEACARSSHPSELVVIQARALRRSSDDLTDTIKAVSDTARKSAAPR